MIGSRFHGSCRQVVLGESFQPADVPLKYRNQLGNFGMPIDFIEEFFRPKCELQALLPARLPLHREWNRTGQIFPRRDCMFATSSISVSGENPIRQGQGGQSSTAAILSLPARDGRGYRGPRTEKRKPLAAPSAAETQKSGRQEVSRAPWRAGSCTGK